MRRSDSVLLVGLCLILILSLGAFLRFHGLAFQSFWNDELSTWARSNYATPAEVIAIGSLPDPHPPAYYLLSYYVQQWIGETEFDLRLPSAIAGVLGILAMFALGRLLYSKEVGLYAAALTAVMWCPVYYSQEARFYSILLLLSILMTFFWVKILRGLARDDLRGLLPLTAPAYIVLSALAAYIHYFGLFLAALQGGYAVLVFVRRRKALVAAIGIYALVLVLYAPWLPAMFGDLTGYDTWIPTPTTANLLEFGVWLFDYSNIILGAAIVGFAFVAWRAVQALRRGPALSWERLLLSRTVILFAWLLAPVTIAWVKSVVSTPVFQLRFLIISLPAAYLLAARALALIPLKQVFRYGLGALATAALLFYLVVRMDYYEKPTKQQFREAVQYVVERDAAVPDAGILGYAWTPDYFNYYFQQFDSPRRVDAVLGAAEDAPQLETFLQKESGQRLWYIAAHKEPDAAFLSALGARMKIVERKDFIGAHVWLFERP